MLLETTRDGLYCAAGDFFIDPWESVDRALITHAHADRAHPGHDAYLTAEPGVGLLRECVGADKYIQGQPYGEPITINGVAVTFFPAGHILGSAQIRLEFAGEVWVFSGDYKLATDPTCEPFVPVPCNVFVTEATFALPVFQWRPPRAIFMHIDDWWRKNQLAGRTSVLLAEEMGQAQRLLAGLDAEMGPLLVHDAVARFLPAYAAAGVGLPHTQPATTEAVRATRGRGLVIAPPTAIHSDWLAKLEPVSLALASGWMQMQGARNRQNIDRGLVFSNHADWLGVLTAIRNSGAETVLVTHGHVLPLVRWLQQQGLQAAELPTPFVGETVLEMGQWERANPSPPEAHEAETTAAPVKPVRPR